jgi:predicted DCC family thiol-disulfide oxidoreductase YuxK
MLYGMSTTAPLTAYYDGLCPICVAEMTHYAEHGKGKIILHDCNGDLPADVDRDAALAALVVRLPDGQLVDGWNAFLALWSVLPGYGWLARLTRPAVIRIPLDRLYRWLAPYRPRRRCSEGICR